VWDNYCNFMTGQYYHTHYLSQTYIMYKVYISQEIKLLQALEIHGQYICSTCLINVNQCLIFIASAAVFVLFSILYALLLG